VGEWSKGLDPIISVSAGDMHSAAVTSSGVLYTWGFGESGALGHGGLGNETSPRPLGAFLHPDPEWVTMVACGAYHTVALTAEGHVWSWGDNDSGAVDGYSSGDKAAATGTVAVTMDEEGQERDSKIRVTPRRVLFSEGGVACYVAAGRLASVVVDKKGTLFKWGNISTKTAEMSNVEASSLEAVSSKSNGSFSPVDISNSTRGVTAFRSVDLGDLQMVAATQLYDGWGGFLHQQDNNRPMPKTDETYTKSDEPAQESRDLESKKDHRRFSQFGPNRKIQKDGSLYIQDPLGNYVSED